MPEAWRGNHANPTHLPSGTDPLPVGIPSDIGVANAEGIAEAFVRQDHVHNRVYPINRLTGVLGVASTWGVAPTNLALCTDDDWVNGTGIGTVLLGAYAVGGLITWDMGQVFNVCVRMKFLLGHDNALGGNARLFIGASDDGIFYNDAARLECTSARYFANNTELLFTDAFVRGRYVQTRMGTEVAATVSFAVYEIQAIDFGL